MDGLNEVVSGLYESTIHDIKDLLSIYPLLRLVITSRKYGYRNQLGIVQYEIQAFNEADIKEYTLRRTGNMDLYHVLWKRNLLHTLASTPLMLKMIADIWIHTNQLPSQFSSLYEKFIDYQLNKSLSVSEEEKVYLLDVYSNLAFELRNTGYISDSVEHLEDFVSILSNTYAQSEMVTRYVEQYVSLNMRNYLGLYPSSGKDHYYKIHDTKKAAIYGYRQGTVWTIGDVEIQIKDSLSHEFYVANDL